MIQISVEEWRKILGINDELYLAEERRDWSVKIATDQVIPAVLERLVQGFLMARRVIKVRDVKRKGFSARTALMTELNIKLLAPATVSTFQNECQK